VTKITSQTSLHELELLVLKYGVVSMTSMVLGADKSYRNSATLITSRHLVRGLGNTLAEALDDAFARLVHLVAQDIACPS
jgi:hypothetical protein